MALFCGRINLTTTDASSVPTEGMLPMLGELAGKGAGSLETRHFNGMEAGFRPLTEDSPRVSGSCFATAPERSLAIVGSARIDNRSDIVGQCSGIFGTRGPTSDIELVLAAYARWGSGCADRLYGDFAFVIWDAMVRTAFCVRDPAGAIPFFYALRGDLLVFGNDQAAVVAGPEIPDELALRRVANYLDTNLVMPPGKTLHRHCRRLRPGHALTVSRGRRQEVDWWKPKNVPDIRFAREEDYVDALAERIERAVASRAKGARRIGTHVSGGLDSSTVSGMLVGQRAGAGLPAPIPLTWNPEPENDAEREHPEAAMLAAFCNAYGMSPLRRPPDIASMVEYFSRDPVRHPPSTMLQMEIPVQRAAQEAGIGTIFSGHGGDQCISYSGGWLYADLLFTGRWQELSREAEHASTHASLLALRALMTLSGFARKSILHRLPFALGGRAGTYRRTSSVRFAPLQRFDPGFSVTTSGRQRDKLTNGYTDMRMDAWAEAGSRRGLRYVYPLLDRSVVEFALGIPPELFARRGETRWIMRQVAARHVPEEVSGNRNKTEPTRSMAMVRALEGTRPALVEALETLDPATPRAELIDVPRLLERLRSRPISAGNGKGPRFLGASRALEMLAIEPRQR